MQVSSFQIYVVGTLARPFDRFKLSPDRGLADIYPAFCPLESPYLPQAYQFLEQGWRNRFNGPVNENYVYHPGHVSPPDQWLKIKCL